MKINKKLLPIKAHYFFFMAAMGPILPQLPVYGKELGISTVVMGAITGVLPFAFLIAKPIFGILVDVYRDHRKIIFMMLILVMSLSYANMAFIPHKFEFRYRRTLVKASDLGNWTETMEMDLPACNNRTIPVKCSSQCFQKPEDSIFYSNETIYFKNTKLEEYFINMTMNTACDLDCFENLEDTNCLYQSLHFWGFVILMCIGTVAFNVVNSISDAICFDVIGEDFDYGKQRVWGTIGFGLTAFIGGYFVDIVSKGSKISYIPAFIVMIICTCFDLFSCINLKLPVIEAPENIWKDFKNLLKDARVSVFLLYAALSGICDSLIIYFLFWYVEDLAVATQTENIKLIEGLIVAAETLGGEILFFTIAGKILKTIGHTNCLSVCFINYALRLGLISIASNPWWIVPIELVFQGPTYALTYTTIVAYANELAPPGSSATMQGIAAGMDDGLGYALGSILGGFLFKYVGGQNTLRIFSLIACFCSISHMIIHKVILKTKGTDSTDSVMYLPPDEAAEITMKS